MCIANTRHQNIAAVALANKTVRIAWAMMTNESDYRPELVATCKIGSQQTAHQHESIP